MPFKGALSGLFQILVLLHDPSVLELEFTNCCFNILSPNFLVEHRIHGYNSTTTKFRCWYVVFSIKCCDKLSIDGFNILRFLRSWTIFKLSCHASQERSKRFETQTPSLIVERLHVRREVASCLGSTLSHWKAPESLQERPLGGGGFSRPVFFSCLFH